jgi:hypothetical protein
MVETPPRRQSPFYIDSTDTPWRVARTSNHPTVELPANNTVKLSEPLRDRVLKAMEVEGFTVWSEFCRVSLTEKCRSVEGTLRRSDPEEFVRIYGKRALAAALRDGD